MVTRFLAVEPRRGWRTGRGSEPRTRLACAPGLQELGDGHDPQAETILLVLDHLNPHAPASRSAAFPPAEARRRTEQLEIHPTPKHGRWLHMAGLELSALARQCLKRRLGDRAAVDREVAASAAVRTVAATTGDWQLTTADARTRLKRLYPANHD